MFFLTNNSIMRAGMPIFNSLLAENANNSVWKVIQDLAVLYQKSHASFGQSAKGSNCFL